MLFSMLFDIFCCVFRKSLSLLIALSTFYIDFLAHFLFFILNCISQAGIKTKSPVQVLFFEKQVKMQLMNSNIPQGAQTTRYSNKKAQNILNLVLFMFCSFFVLQRWWRQQGSSNSERKCLHFAATRAV